MKYKLYTLQPKQKLVGVGTLCIGEKEKDAMFFAGDGDAGAALLADMHRVQIDWAAKAGVQISGMQPDGCASNGTRKYKFQQWFLAYIEGGL